MCECCRSLISICNSIWSQMCSSFAFVFVVRDFTVQSQLISDNKCQKAKDLPICVDNASFLDPYLLHIWLVIDFRSNLVLISMTTLSEVSKLLEALLLLHFHFRAILNSFVSLGNLVRLRLIQWFMCSTLHELHMATLSHFWSLCHPQFAQKWKWSSLHGNFVTFLESLSPLICTRFGLITQFINVILNL